MRSKQNKKLTTFQTPDVSERNFFRKVQKPVANLLIATMLLLDIPPFLVGQQIAQAAALTTDPKAWVTVTPKADPIMQNLNIPANAATQGMWSAAFSWPMNGLHNMILPDGKVLTFGTDASGNAQDGRLFDIWDPYLGFGANSHNSSYQAAQQDSFCGTATYLNDGNLLVTGGNSGNGGFGKGSLIYNPVTNTRATAQATTALPRWYSTMIGLPDGRKLVMGGMVPYTEGMYQDTAGAIARGEPSMTPEVYENGAWRSLFGANSRLAFGPDFLRTSYPHAFVAPSGLVFGISADRMWYLNLSANNNTGGVFDFGEFKPGYGNKPDPDNVGALSVAVMYDIGKIIQVGGNGGFNGDGFPSSNKATRIDINGVTPVLTELPRMNIARRYGNGIVLANGEVVITGGTRFGNNAGGNEVFAAEIWNPNSNSWRLGASASTIRVYHSITSLLLNGAIISTGGGTPGPVLNKTGEVYYPPYLFEQVGGASRLATRPVIKGISGLKYAHGASMQLDMDSTASISGLVLIGLSNGTHSFNNGQRRIPLTFTQEDNRLTTTIPDANLTPPGYYQVVALNAQGVPSYAYVIAVGAQMAAPQVLTTPYDPGAVAPPPANVPPTVSLTAPAAGVAYTQGATVAMTASAADSDGSVVYVDFYDGNTLVGSDTSAPYTFNWVTSASTTVGNHSLTAVAVDNAGTQTISAARSITINQISSTADSDSDGIVDIFDTYPNDASRGAGIWREQYNNIGGGVLVADLMATTKYPNAPDVVEKVTTFTGPTDISDNYGSRIRGIFTAPETGAYTFWVAGDDEVRLFLSTDHSAANKRQIAYVPGWSFPNEWTKYNEQKSVAINLVAGQNYYLEVLQKEGAGGDGVAVAWQTPSNQTLTVMTDQYFQKAGGTGGGGTGTLPIGVAGAWSFNEGSGVSVADVSGNNRPLTLSNATWVAGISGQAAQFNGANTSGTVGQAVVDTAASFSVSAWVKLDNLNGWQTIVNQDGVNVSGFWLQFSQYVNGNKFMLTMHDVDSTASTAYRAVSTTAPVVGQWYHLVGVRDKATNTMKMYVNGVLESTIPYTGGWAANGALNVGRGKWGGPNDWVAGAIDGVSVYTRALTGAEVSSLYQAKGSADPVNPPSGSTPPSNAVACANEGGTCTLPAGVTATVWYGLNNTWNNKTGVVGNIGCNNDVFGDPIPGTGKVCRYLSTVTPPPANVAPTVTLTAPAGGATYTRGANVAMTATAADSDGSVARVEFYDGATLLGTDTTAPYAFNWVTTTSTATGAHNLTARAYDNIGAVTTSAAVNVTVNAVTPTVSPTASSAITYERRTGASDRVWVVNPDNDSVSVIDAATNTLIQSVSVGLAPRTIAIAPNGNIWVTNKDSATISVISPSTLAVVQTIAMPRASQPYGLTFAANGSSAFVVLEALGQLRKLDSTNGALQSTLAVGSNSRHVSVTADSATVLVSRFITPALPGEGTATVDTSTAGAEVFAVNAGAMTLNKTIVLRHSDKADTTITGSGIPNYLGAVAISPDGKTAWVPSKQDNIKRGMARNGQPLNFQNTVRAISSRIDMTTLTEDLARRIDHDNSSFGSAAVYHPSGSHLFVALETSREVAVIDPATGVERFRINVGRAPQGLAISPDGNTLYVQEFMDRSVSVVDLSQLINSGTLNALVTKVIYSVPLNQEKLPANIVLGKQLFYDAKDPRLSLDSYMSCASCHNDGGHDGRVWDLTGFGEGLRNTIALKGRAAMGHGNLHWSANFDELQDFEGQIRALAGGLGLMSDAQLNTGTRNQPLGDKKAGVSADLDNLAAYVASLNTFAQSPSRNADGTLTAAATAGKTVFANSCASCHGGANFTTSSDGGNLKSIGTINALSGKRLNATLNGIDTPTLRDAWATAPYLHNGSAPTITAAVQAHNNLTLNATDLANVVAYVQQIGSEEATGGTPPNVAPTVTLTAPAGGATYTRGANVAMTATAADSDGSVARVEFYDGATLLGTDTTAPYAFNWVTTTSTATGAHSLTARAYDNTGAVTTSGAVAVTINTPANVAPTVSITSPTSATTYIQGAAYNFTATANDSDGVISKVEFYYNGDGLLATLNQAPYTISGSTAGVFPGDYTITAKAYDDKGAVTTSAPIVVTISPAAQNKSPTVAIVTPSSNIALAKGAPYTITASASDTDGTIERVEIYYNGDNYLTTLTSSPYTLTGSTADVPAGQYSITAKAYDNNGATTTSQPVVITVNP